MDESPLLRLDAILQVNAQAAGAEAGSLRGQDDRGLFHVERFCSRARAVLDVALDDAIPGVFKPVKAGHLHVGDDVVLAAEVEHNLRFPDASDYEAGEGEDVGGPGSRCS